MLLYQKNLHKITTKKFGFSLLFHYSLTDRSTEKLFTKIMLIDGKTQGTQIITDSILISVQENQLEDKQTDRKL